MNHIVRIGAVSYLNTKPLLYGITNSELAKDIEIVLDYPAKLAQMLSDGNIDVALLPVAAMPGIPGAGIISKYGIATNGNVVSVALFSEVPIENIETVYLDYQSRTSVRLAQLLLQQYWKKQVVFLQADEQYITKISGKTAGVIIGDRALQQLHNFKYTYDLSAAWKAHTGLDFIFAAWVANKALPAGFSNRFDNANAEGLLHIDKVIAENPYPHYDLHTYYTKNICFELDAAKKEGMQLFLKLINDMQ